VWGTAVCPARPATWQVYREKLREFLRRFPGLAGLQITGDETQVSDLECRCARYRDMSRLARVQPAHRRNGQGL